MPQSPDLAYREVQRSLRVGCKAHPFRIHHTLLLLALLCSFRPLPRVHAQVERAATSHWTASAEGLHLDWQISATAAGASTADQLTAALQSLPTVQFGAYPLPMALQTVALSADAPGQPQIRKLVAQPWTPPAPVPPLAPVGSEATALPRITPAADELPTAPLFLLREGRLRGQRVAVIAFSPVYQNDGQTYIATELQASLPHAQPLATPSIRSLRPSAAQVSPEQMPPGPTNPAALGSAIKVVVEEVGLQQIAGSALVEAGLHAGTDLDLLQLTFRATPVALEVRDDDGRLDAGSELRFYAGPFPHSIHPGDRWNDTAIYWLTLTATPGLRMMARAVLSGTAPLRDSAYETGIWEQNRRYESTMPGVDGDHWFAATLQAGTALTGTEAILSIPLTSSLPLASGLAATATLTMTGSVRTMGTHALQATFGQSTQTITWSTPSLYESWQQTIQGADNALALALRLPADQPFRELYVDKVSWRLPVMLDFRAQGATFVGVAGLWRYRLTNLPPAGALYDITEPLQPQSLTTPWASTLTFEDGPAPRTYLVAGPGAMHRPSLLSHQPVHFDLTGGTDVVYIAPALFHDELAPLVAHRREQGYAVQVVDLQAIYDAWSFGQVDPKAIRAFLRYAVAHWQPAPLSAVLVGDATVDPHNYQGYGNPNLLPAYFAEVDPWLGEAPCEGCFAQLDGNDPLDTAADPGFLPDLWLGRFSVQDEPQLTAVVQKLLAYESAPALPYQPYASLYVADNHLQSNGQPDPAGDFAALLDQVIVGDAVQRIQPLQSPNLRAERLYYDPQPDGVMDPWREPDGALARQRVIEALQRNPRLVVYHGHANHFQWASTLRSLPEPYLLGTNDLFALPKNDQLSILLEMTCLTAQFTHPSTTGTTIDERFHRLPGTGAVAVWGSAGLTVAYGHAALLSGFHQALWAGEPMTTPVGALLEAGYLELFTNAVCCQETRQLYLLLGDPLTPARIWSSQSVTFLPTVGATSPQSPSD